MRRAAALVLVLAALITMLTVSACSAQLGNVYGVKIEARGIAQKLPNGLVIPASLIVQGNVEQRDSFTVGGGRASLYVGGAAYVIPVNIQIQRSGTLQSIMIYGGSGSAYLYLSGVIMPDGSSVTLGGNLIVNKDNWALSLSGKIEFSPPIITIP